MPEQTKYIMRMFELPNHLQRTLIALIRCGHATAYDVAAETKKQRSVESAHLNQLVYMRMVKKSFGLRRKYFDIDYEGPGW